MGSRRSLSDDSWDDSRVSTPSELTPDPDARRALRRVAGPGRTPFAMIASPRASSLAGRTARLAEQARFLDAATPDTFKRSPPGPTRRRTGGRGQGSPCESLLLIGPGRLAPGRHRGPSLAGTRWGVIALRSRTNPAMLSPAARQCGGSPTSRSGLRNPFGFPARGEAPRIRHRPWPMTTTPPKTKTIRVTKELAQSPPTQSSRRRIASSITTSPARGGPEPTPSAACRGPNSSSPRTTDPPSD